MEIGEPKAGVIEDSRGIFPRSAEGDGYSGTEVAPQAGVTNSCITRIVASRGMVGEEIKQYQLG